MGMKTTEEVQDFAEYEEIKEEDAAIQVENEKHQSANGETVSFDESANPSDVDPSGVGPETGEVKQAEETTNQAPAY